MTKGCGTIYLGAYREFYGNRLGKNSDCGRAWNPDKLTAFGATENNVTEEIEPGLWLSTTSSVICPQDAKLCPDGVSYVGRTGPDCEFKPCPDEASTPLLTEEGGYTLLDPIENPVALETNPPRCTKIVGVLYDETGDRASYTDGCIKQDLMSEGYIYLDPPNLRTGSDLQIDQTRTATDPITSTARTIPTNVAFYSPWNKTGTIRNTNVSPAATNPCGNPNYMYRQDNMNPYDLSAIGDPYCWCDKSAADCDLNPKPVEQPQPSATPILALAALAFLVSS